MSEIVWSGISNIQSKPYTCGHCGESLTSEKGYTYFQRSSNTILGYIYICHFCHNPTFFNSSQQVPGSLFGNKVEYISDEKIEKLYDEARKCYSSNAYTGVILCCRKLLMNIAVSKGAEEGKRFVDYVNYLVDNHFVPPDAKDWVDHIRNKGNEATHEIKIMDKADAEDLITFSEMLLKLVFEFPAKIQNKKEKELIDDKK